MSQFTDKVAEPLPPEPTAGERLASLARACFKASKTALHWLWTTFKAWRRKRRILEKRARTKRIWEYRNQQKREKEAARLKQEQLVQEQVDHCTSIIETLEDDFNQLRVYLKPLLKSRPSSETNGLIEMYCGKVTGVSIGNSNRQNVANTIGDMGTHWKQGAVRAGLYDGDFHACRTVADLHEREIAVLKILAICVLEGEVERETLDKLLRIIVVNQGNCTVYSGGEDGKFIEPKGNSDHITLTIVQQWVSKLHQPSALAVNEAIVLIGNIRKSTQNETILTTIDQNLNPGNKWRDVG